MRALHTYYAEVHTTPRAHNLYVAKIEGETEGKKNLKSVNEEICFFLLYKRGEESEKEQQQKKGMAFARNRHRQGRQAQPARHPAQ